MSAELVARDLAVQYGQRTLVAVDALTVADGELTALIGPSGSGKTLLLRALLDLLPKGLRGRAALSRGGQPVSRRSLGWLPQDARTALDPLRTVGEQLETTAAASDSPREVSDALRAVGLRPADADRFPRTLSGGMAQRVVLAQLLLQRARTLLVDEPVTGLDPVRSAEVIERLQHVAAEGCGVLWVSHDLRLVQQRAQRIGLMHQGALCGWASELAALDHPVALDLMARTPGLRSAS